MFRPDGSWMPDQINQPNFTQPQNRFAEANPSFKLQNFAPQSFGQVPMIGNQQMNPGQFINPALTQGLNSPSFVPQNQGVPYGGMNNSMAANAINNAQMANQPNYMQQAPQGYGVQQLNDLTPLNTYNPMAQKQLPPSMTQSVNMSDPQARQDYLNFLTNKLPQGGQNNAWRNPAGIQGEQAQAGFQGFQQNGQPYPQQAPAPKQYAESSASRQLGYQANQASGGNQVTAAVPTPQQAPTNARPPFGRPGSNMNSQQNQNNQSGNQQNGGYPNPPEYKQPNRPVAASDIASKQNIESGEGQLKEFLDSLGVYDYEYKDPKYGDGRRISPMAQEIEQTPLGKAAISTNEEGYKVVDYGKLGGTMLASLALLNNKYNKLEEKLKSSVLAGLKDKRKK